MDRSSSGFLLTIVIFIIFISSSESFYLPGVAPRDFQRGDPLQVKVNKLSSTKTQLPYDYYYLNYCKPKEIQNTAEILGEVLRGDRIENSVYTFQMREELPCKVGCRLKLDAESAKKFKEKIDDEYRVNMILDNLPVAVLRQRRDGSPSTTYEHGFRVGFKGNYAGSKDEKYFINNHLSFRVMYHKDLETDSARIVGFEVTPNSINHEYKEWDEKNPQLTTCNQNTKNIIQGSTVPQEVDTGKEVVFTYDVTFKFLVDAGLYESQEEAAKREKVLGRIKQIVIDWVKQLTRLRGYTDQMVEDANAAIFTFGSYRLGVHGPGADIDTLCVGPSYVNRDEDFFFVLHD